MSEVMGRSCDGSTTDVLLVFLEEDGESDSLTFLFFNSNNHEYLLR